MDEIKELKALAYDLIAQSQYCEQQLAAVNEKIAKLSQEAQNQTQPTNEASDISAAEV